MQRGNKIRKEDEGSDDAVLYSKEQLLTSVRYKDKRDLLNAILEDNQMVSIVQADEIIQKFERKVGN